MLKLLWSWVLLIVLASLALVYQPEILTAQVELIIAGSKYAVHAWFILFLIVLLLISVLTLSNLVFFWQRRLLIRKCKKLNNGIKAIAKFTADLADGQDEKQLLKTVKQMAVPAEFRTMLQKSLLKESNSESSLITLWWHGNWQRFSELVCYAPIQSIWSLHACSHIFLLGGFQGDLLPSFIRAWEQNSERMLQAFPTIAEQVQIKLFDHYSLLQLQKVWVQLPKKFRKQNQVCLAYAKALSNHKAWPEVQEHIEENLLKGWNKFLGEWYLQCMPRSLLSIEQLQKWHKQAPMYLTKPILLALARAHAAKSDWITTQTLITRISEPELTFSLELELHAQQGNWTQLTKLIQSDFFCDTFA